LVADNASNNDNETISSLAGHLGIPLTSEHRVRCGGHIIQLVVKAVIYGKGISTFEAELARAAPQDQFDIYRQHGVVGKLHNFVNAVLASHKRREAFMTYQATVNADDPLWSFGTLSLIQDGGVRWHSVYLMLLRCYELKNAITTFIRKWRGTNDDSAVPSNAALTDVITEEEWEEVDSLCKFLRVFYSMTKRLEGNGEYGSLWMTIVNLQHLYDELHRMQEELESEGDDCYLKNGVAFGIEKLTSYWGKIVIDPPISYYCVATILNPQLRLIWFKDHWRKHPSWHKKAEASMKAVFQQYVDAEAEEVEDDEPAQLTRRKLPGGEYHDDGYERTLSVDMSLLTGSRSYKKQRKTTELQQYYDSYQEDFTMAKDDSPLFKDPLTWWLEVGRHSYPTLYKIALDFLSIPCTSCDCERAFSGGRRTCTFERNKLCGHTIEALQLQKNWLRKHAVHSELTVLATHIGAVTA
jgi:hypothetical protein